MITAGDRLPGDVTVVSSIQLEAGTQYRLVGEPPAGFQAAPVEPTLEDAYIWLMQQNQLEPKADWAPY